MMENSLENLEKLTFKQQRFLEWLALPKAERHPHTQELLAEELKVTPTTLSAWKKKFNLEERAMDLADEWLAKHYPDVLYALASDAKRGNNANIKLYLEKLGRYIERREYEVKGDVVITWDDAPD